MQSKYLNVVALAERVHRRALEFLDGELSRLGVPDLNATQAMILLQMGRNQMTVSELTLRGCYQGTNVSYNLKRLTESGYVVQERSGWDRRVINVRVSDKGAALLEHLERFYMGLDAELTGSELDAAVVVGCAEELAKLETRASLRSTSSSRSVGGRPLNVLPLEGRKRVA